MRADEVLVAQHEVLRGLLHELAGTADGEVARRQELLDRFEVELEVHTQVEDELFYPAVRDVSPLLSLAHAEHRQIDDQLAVVLRTDPAGPELVEQVRLLAATLEHHTLEEEQRMFPQSQALGERRQQELGEQLQQRQRELAASGPARTMFRLKREVLRRL